jgi:hypothetical protein
MVSLSCSSRAELTAQCSTKTEDDMGEECLKSGYAGRQGIEGNEPCLFKLLPPHNVPLVQLESEYKQENREPVDHPGGK